jgi:hypothetical protein
MTVNRARTQAVLASIQHNYGKVRQYVPSVHASLTLYRGSARFAPMHLRAAARPLMAGSAR